MTTYRLKDASGFINGTSYFVSGPAISAAKRESTRRCRSGKFCGNSDVYVMEMADMMANIWAKDKTVFIASPHLTT